MKTHVIAVIGCGRIANNAHFPAMAKMENLRVKYACDLSGVNCGAIEGEIFVAPRRGDGREGVILVEHSGKNSAVYNFDGKLRNVATGEVCEGRIELPPYGIAVLERP